jgi:D-glycero-D-manno-heptose 1,7-bisphosphate phosphatase
MNLCALEWGKRLDRAVFLDRDGVINRAIVRNGVPHPPSDLREFVWMDGVHETLREPSAHGYTLLIVTNQPDVARGVQTLEQLESMHRLILAELPIARIYPCAHDDADACACRKPNPA